MKRRILSIIITLALCLSLWPAFAWEEEPDAGLCRHHPAHTEDCGYVPAAEDGGGSPCCYHCQLCPLEDLIAALPGGVTPDNAEEVRSQLDEILALFSALPEEDQFQIDLSRCYELRDALTLYQGELPGTEMMAEEPEDKSGGLIFEYSSTVPKTETVYKAGSGTITWTPQLEGEQVVSGKLTLSNATISASNGNGIKIPVSTTVVLDGNNQINVTQNDRVGIRVEDIYSSEHETLTIQGTGSLAINSTGYGIFAQGDVSIEGGANIGIEVSTQSGGIYTNFGSIFINDSTVKAKTPGGTSNNSVPLTSNNGNIIIENSHVVAISSNGAAIKAGQSIMFTNSDVVIVGKSAVDSQGAYEGTLIFGMYNGGKINISGGTLYAENKYDNAESSNYGYDIPYLRSYITATDSAVIYYKHDYRQLVQNGNNIQYRNCTYDENTDKITTVGNAFVMGTVEWNKNIIFGATTAINNYNQIVGTGSVAGNIIIPNGVTVTIPSGSGIYNYGTITNNGTVVVENVFQSIADASKVGSTGTVINNGTIDIKVSGDMRSTGTITNNGTLNIEGIYYNYPTGRVNGGIINGAILEYNISESPKQFYFVAHGDAKLHENDLKFMGNANNTLRVGTDASVGQKQTMTVPADATLTIQENCTVDASQSTLGVTWETLSDYLSVAGSIVVDGTLKLPASPDQTKLTELLSHITGSGQVLIGDSAVYPITVTGGTADKRFAAAGEEVTLTPEPNSSSRQFKSWEVSPSTVNISDNKFTMPNQAVTVTGKYATLLTGAAVQVTGTYIYNGSAQNPAVKVTLGGKELTKGTDYTVACGSINAGKGTATITGTGDYAGEVTAEFDIEPASLTVTGLTGSTSKTYDGKTACDGTGLTVTFTGKISNDDISVSAGTFVYDSAAAGTGKTVTASGLTPAGAAAGNYKLDSADSVSGAVGTITKAIVDSSLITPQNLNIANHLASTYTFLLSNLRPTISGDWGTVEYTISVSFTGAGYYSSGAQIIAGPSGALNTLSLPILSNKVETTGQVGTVTVTVKSTNYEDFTNEIHIMAQNKKRVSFGGVEGVTAVYNGRQVTGYTGTLTITDSDGKPVELTPEIRYTGRMNTSWDHADTPPTNAGTYSVIFRVPDSDPDYIGRENVAFEITPASITIAADNKSADAGSAKPNLTYTVTGLAPGETLSAAPTLTCDADMNTVGSYPITASGAAVPAGGNYNEEIQYLPGTLTVNAPYIPPTPTEIPVTGVQLDPSAAALHPGGMLQLTAAVEPDNTTQSKSVTWSSSDPAVAEVDSSGNVIAHAPGIAVITVRTVSGGYTAACTVTVEAPEPETFTISYSANGGTGTMADGTAAAGEAFTLPECGFTAPEGKVFDTWAVGSVGGEKAAAGSSYTFTADTTVYALWKDGAAESYTITYHANGGGGTMGADAAMEGEAFILPGCAFTPPEGKVFDAWAIGGVTGPQVQPGGSYTFTADTSVYAVWKDLPAVPGSITGTVWQNGEAVPGAAVQLKLGADVIAAQTTGADGSFAFHNVPAGVYNLVAEKDGITVTVKQTVSGSGANIRIILPNGKTNTVVEVKDETPPVVVGNMEKLFASDMLYTAGDKEAVAAGGTVEFKMVVEELDASSPAVIRIVAGKPAGQTIGLFLDLSIVKTVSPQGGEPESTFVTQTGSLIEILIPLPEEMQGKASYTIYREHDGAVETLPNSGSGERYEVSGDKTSITIFARKYSVYAIAWSNSGGTPVDPVEPDKPVPGYVGGGGSSASAYAVTVEKAEHGKVTSNRASAYAGSTVTLTVTPDSGYMLDTLAVTGSQGAEIRLTAQDGGKYTFTMPGRAVTVRAVFTPLPEDMEQPCGGADCPSHSFTDLGAVGTWYHEAVDYVLRSGLMSGYNSTLFGPNDHVSRAMLAQILYNKEGKPVVTGGSVFTDVPDGKWYAPAVTWAAANGIADGYGGGLFGPDIDISREQLATMLWRYAGSPAAADRELHFIDADEASGYALDALCWAAENNILNGCGGGRLDPGGLATRAQTAQMLKNFLEGR